MLHYHERTMIVTYTILALAVTRWFPRRVPTNLPQISGLAPCLAENRRRELIDRGARRLSGAPRVFVVIPAMIYYPLPAPPKVLASASSQAALPRQCCSQTRQCTVAPLLAGSALRRTIGAGGIRAFSFAELGRTGWDRAVSTGSRPCDRPCPPKGSSRASSQPALGCQDLRPESECASGNISALAVRQLGYGAARNVCIDTMHTRAMRESR